MSRLLAAFIAFLTLLYPLAVYYSVQFLAPWKIALSLLLLLTLRFFLNTNKQWGGLLLGGGILYCGFAIWQNSLLSLRFYPVLMNLSLLAIFFSSLIYPPPIIERFARLQHPNLPPEGVKYTYKVTQVWCGFFIINGFMATATALWCDIACWSLYNGFISYLLMALLMGVEYLVRIRTQAHVR